ncbi:dTMP kinase [Streptomyces sp. NPDC045456]|uniref:dTMP kinase n=1 Tax=Streptomyces sp. NPDC045456 TaxID=3155254 RepID=UPI0033D4E767
MSLDGPGGVGKSSVAKELERYLRERGVSVHLTREPTDSVLGDLARHGTERYRGMEMACLVAADRYGHLRTDIRPARGRGDVVISDRYIASSLVLQRLDDVPLATIWNLNKHADPPDLAVILVAEADRITERLRGRGAHSRYERMPGSTEVELHYYGDAVVFMRSLGIDARVLDTTFDRPDEIARNIGATINALRHGKAHGT